MAGYKSAEEMSQVLARMAELMASDPGLVEASRRTNVAVAYEFRDLGVSFYTRMGNGSVEGGLGEIANPDVRIMMKSSVFDGIFSGTLNAMSAYEMGQLSFTGNMSAAMRLEGLVGNFGRVYRQAKADCLGEQKQ